MLLVFQILTFLYSFIYKQDILIVYNTNKMINIQIFNNKIKIIKKISKFTNIKLLKSNNFLAEILRALFLIFKSKNTSYIAKII